MRIYVIGCNGSIKAIVLYLVNIYLISGFKKRPYLCEVIFLS